MLPRKKMLKRSFNTGWGNPNREKGNLVESYAGETKNVDKILHYW